jgi:hypothetical protein
LKPITLSAIKKEAIALTAFSCLVLIYTRLDYLVNDELYFYGLKFSGNWFVTNQIVYILLYQSGILTLQLYHKNLKLTLFLEAFVVTSTQDLVFFGLWNHGVFPVAQWTWTTYYALIGFWNTNTQILASFTVFAGAAIALFLMTLTKSSKLAKRQLRP